MRCRCWLALAGMLALVWISGDVAKGQRGRGGISAAPAAGESPSALTAVVAAVSAVAVR